MSVNGLTVAVAGLGPMGRGIARLFRQAGADVIVSDVSPEATQQGIERISAEAAEDGHPVDVRGDSLSGAIAQADLFIEAIVENMAAKAALLDEVRQHGSSDLIIASNTSSLSIGEMGKEFGDPARVIGMHFFNPPTKMRLVEVIRGAATSDAVHEKTLEIVEGIGKTAITCADSPNFVVNRVCRPLYYEAQLLVMQGTEAAVVDTVARSALGHRMGPLELLDFTGLHTHLASSETALREFGDPRYRPIPGVRSLVRNGMTGRAAGRGFYDYATETPRAARERVLVQSEGPAPVPVRLAGPHASALQTHPLVRAASTQEHSDVVVYSCHRPPVASDVRAVEEALETSRVVIDSSDAGWLTALPPGAEWLRLHANRDDVFAEVVDDDEADIHPGEGVATVLDALGASSVRVPALPGLVADRLATCLANEAFAVVEEGTAGPGDVNTALRLAMNHPQGPFEYVDRVGVTEVYETLSSMLNAFGDPRYRPAQLLRRRYGAITRAS